MSQLLRRSRITINVISPTGSSWALSQAQVGQPDGVAIFQSCPCDAFRGSGVTIHDDGDGPHASAVPGILALGGVSPGPEAEILTIGVAESWRGRGLGGRLLDELVSAAVREGAETVFLEVRSRSEGARALYEGRGFVPVGLRRRYYRDDDALVMRRDVRR